MMGANFWHWASAALALSLPAAAKGTEAALVTPPGVADAVPAEELVIPFAPPLDRAMRYNVVTRKKSAKKDETRQLDQTVSFARRGEGYVMTVTTLKGSVAGLDELGFSFGRIEEIPVFLRPFFEPMKLELSDQGEILSLLEWEKISQAFRAAAEPLSQVTETDPAKRPATRKVLEEFYSQIANLPASHAPQVMAKSWTSVMGYAGTAGETGREYSAEGVLPAGLMPVPIPFRGHYGLTRTVEGGIRYNQRYLADGAALRAAVEDYFLNLGANMPEANRQNMLATIAAFENVEMTDSADIYFDADGLVSHAMLTRDVGNAAGEAGTETIEIRRIGE